MADFVYDLTPGAPRRIYRFVDTLEGNLVASLDKKTNILLIDREKFDLLTHGQKEQIYITKDHIEYA